MGILTAILDLLFPPKCIFCQKLLRAGTKVCCEDCAKALSQSGGARSGMFFRTCCVPLTYEGQVRDAIIRFKFKDHPAMPQSSDGLWQAVSGPSSRGSMI